jgi:hypothetical protein
LAKLLALAMIIIVGFVWLGKGSVQAFDHAFSKSSANGLSYGTAMYLALFSYNGWVCLPAFMENGLCCRWS